MTGYRNQVQPRKIKQHKIQQNKTTLVQWTSTTLGQETRWAYSTAPEPTRGASSRHGHHRGAQVHGAHQAASHVPALYLPSYSRYSFTDPERQLGA